MIGRVVAEEVPLSSDSAHHRRVGSSPPAVRKEGGSHATLSQHVEYGVHATRVGAIIKGQDDVRSGGASDREVGRSHGAATFRSAEVS